MKKIKAKSHGVANKSIYACLLVVFCMVLITVSEPLMGWVWVLCACAITIASIRISRNLPSVKNITLNLLAIFCMVLLIYLSGSFGLMATMVNLLVVAACLKLINLHSRSDYHVVLIVLFFLIACGFIYHQSIYFVAYYFACLVVLFVTAFLLNKGALDLPSSIKQSTKMMLQALPITLVLFVVTPRLPPFWQTDVESNTQTGLAEELTPGDIANLAQSAELVFRAEFDTNIPTPQERYWRSIVLDYFDGKTWRITNEYSSYTPDISSLMQTTRSSALTPTDYRYLVIAQANNTKWLYSLDIPIVEENMSAMGINVNRQYQLFQTENSKNSSLYIVRSFTQSPLRNFTPETDFARYLQAPLESNKRTQKWIKDNINSAMSFAEKLAILNGYFLDNPFAYTLKPPLMPLSPVDAFLFDNQQGFCSHYASALTYMLRLSDVPARIVAGYQGGEEQGENILTIRQFDAHAWVEAYDKEYGWIRFDPTALVAPNRTLSGLMSALNAQESAIFEGE
ncbi:MAG: transglutaminase-like putative cysteine protease, partial [Glaciecola sp.]